VLDLRAQAAEERQILEARLSYAGRIGDVNLFNQTFSALNSRERIINENLLEGQIALIALSQQNFTPAIDLYERADIGGTLTVIPYTDGTFGFIRDGQEISRVSVREIARELYNTYASQSIQ
jgi:hypothetical protein